ncbi:MAG: hypothetical protein IJB56_07680, partial [Alistipes sp.]|nr:hypothetical protein [Alistipes sp.]
MCTVEVEAIAMAAMLKVERIAQFGTPLQALANLAAQAVARLHHSLAHGRSPAVQALDDMLHAVALIEGSRERVYDIM